MITKEAIELLQQPKNTEASNSAIESAFGALDHQSVAALPETFKLHSLEGYQRGRFRFRGAFTTDSIDGFTAYIKDHAKSECACFIETEKMRATTIFNIGTVDQPGHCDDRAKLQLEMTAPYKALQSIIDRKLNQKEVAEFIEDWRQHITASYSEDAEGNRENVNLIKLIHSIRKITIEAKSSNESDVRNFGASSTSMDSIDVKSADMPPDYLYFICEPYAGLTPRAFELRLNINTADRSFPALTLRIVQQELIKENMAKEFEEVLDRKLSDLEHKAKLYLGDFNA
jgi:uncharacterized protein YfdQ (DUF2303 family)